MKRSQSPDPERIQPGSSSQDAIQDQAQEASSRLTEDHKKANAKTLQAPFQDTRPGPGPAPDETPSKSPPSIGVNQNASLAGTAITSIIHQTKPSCTKAQTWIETQRLSDQERARAAYKAMNELSARVESRQYVRLEKVAAIKLARKVREMRMGQQSQQSQDSDMRMSQDRDMMLSPQEKIQQASIRLQRALRVAHWD